MATFQKPENALKRAEELIEVGKKTDALETLHAAIQHRRFKNLWTNTIELIMIRHLELCVELKKMRTAREGLHQYRTTCQAANIASLEHVVQKFRKHAEEKVNEAKREKDAMAEVGDLDEMEAPQTILLKAIQAQDTRQQSQDRDIHAHFRFLWDTYKVVLDVLRSNVRLEDVYHETARAAFEFCRVNKRPQEFKRLCETLRKNYQELFKRTGPIPQHQVNPSRPETISLTLETRCKQLQIATELDLWRESYFTAQEIYDLMNKIPRPKPHLRSMYYEYLGQIFWKSENFLFHAFACLKNLLFVKAAKQNLSKEELTFLASKAVMATLCVPFEKTSDIHATLELTTEGGSSPYEKAKKHATLFNVQSVPTRDSIISSIKEKGILAYANEPCRRLFALIESDFTPLSLCQDAKPFLDEVNTEEVCEGNLMSYITPLKQIIFFRLIKQLSQVYANMTIENFERAASIVPFSIAEKWMANAARHQGISIQINYSHQAIVFGAPRKVDMKSMRQPLIEIGYKLQQAMQRVAPSEQHKKERLEKEQLSQNIVPRIEEETRLIRQRKEEIERRKEESERLKDIQEKEAMEKQRKQEAREAEAERQRQEEERRRREIEREEQRRRDAAMAKNKEMLETMKKQAEARPGNLKVAGKKITEIVADDLETIGFDQIERAREQQVQRERQEKIRQRKMESKRIDHLARALREEQTRLLDDWAETIQDKDYAFLDKAEGQKAEEQKVKHEELLKEKAVILPFQAMKDSWMDSQLEARRTEYEEQVEERTQRLMRIVCENKVRRARQRMEQWEREEQERQEEEDRQREEEERAEAEERARKRREQDEEEEKQRQEEERIQREEEERQQAEERKAKEEQRRREAEERRREQDEQRERAEAKRRQREQEIEERQKKESAERSAAPPPRERGSAWGRGGGGGGGGGGKDAEEDSWRRGGDRSGGDDRDSQRKGGAWGDRQARDRDDEPRSSWGRPGARDNDGDRKTPTNRAGGRDDGDSWRRQAPAAESPRKAWGQPRGGDAGRERGDDDQPAADEGDDAGGWSNAKSVRRGPKEPPAEETRPPAEPEPAAKPEEEEEGWSNVGPGKKKKAKDKVQEVEKTADDEGWNQVRGAGRRNTAGGDDDDRKGGAGEARPSPPWRKPGTASAPRDSDGKGGDDGAWRNTRDAPGAGRSRENWKSRGQEAEGERGGGAGGRDMPWRRNTGGDRERGGGASDGNWRR